MSHVECASQLQEEQLLVVRRVLDDEHTEAPPFRHGCLPGGGMFNTIQ